MVQFVVSGSTSVDRRLSGRELQQTAQTSRQRAASERDCQEREENAIELSDSVIANYRSVLEYNTGYSCVSKTPSVTLPSPSQSFIPFLSYVILIENIPTQRGEVQTKQIYHWLKFPP